MTQILSDISVRGTKYYDRVSFQLFDKLFLLKTDSNSKRYAHFFGFGNVNTYVYTDMCFLFPHISI